MENKLPKMDFRTFCNQVAGIARVNPMAWGLYQVASGQSKSKGTVAEEHLKECFEKGMTPAETVEDWVF